MSPETNKALPTPDELCRWLEAHGWVRRGPPTEQAIVYRHPDFSGSWADVPVNPKWCWYEASVVQALGVVARSLARTDPVGFMRALDRMQRADEVQGGKP